MPTKKTTKKVAAALSKKAAKKAVKKLTKKAKPSLDAIAKAAYLNYLRRTDLGLPGDNHSDWAEAERTLSQG